MLIMLWWGRQGGNLARGVYHSLPWQCPLCHHWSLTSNMRGQGTHSLRGDTEAQLTAVSRLGGVGVGGHSPSIAYFISWANRFHITSALILPTFNSWGNLVKIIKVWNLGRQKPDGTGCFGPPSPRGQCGTGKGSGFKFTHSHWLAKWFCTEACFSLSLHLPIPHSFITPLIHLPSHPFTHPSVYSPIPPSHHPSIPSFIPLLTNHPSTYYNLFIHPPINPSSHLSIHPSIHSPIHSSTCLYIHLFIYPSPFTCPNIPSSIHPLVHSSKIPYLNLILK